MSIVFRLTFNNASTNPYCSGRKCERNLATKFFIEKLQGTTINFYWIHSIIDISLLYYTNLIISRFFLWRNWSLNWNSSTENVLYTITLKHYLYLIYFCRKRYSEIEWPGLMVLVYTIDGWVRHLLYGVFIANANESYSATIHIFHCVRQSLRWFLKVHR